SGDMNPIHRDEAFARRAGMQGVFAHGMLSMAFVAQGVTDWLGIGTIRRMKVRFTGLVRLGDRVSCHGVVLEKHSIDSDGLRNSIHIRVSARNDRGEEVV